jgi:hypothetical protein
MKAQWLYNFREQVEMFSGADLHEFFNEQIGDPSPSGYTEINGANATRFVHRCINAARHNSPSITGECDDAARKWNEIQFTHDGKMPNGIEAAVHSGERKS